MGIIFLKLDDVSCGKVHIPRKFMLQTVIQLCSVKDNPEQPIFKMLLQLLGAIL